MKQLAQYQDGRLELQEVPVPMPPPGGVLVRVTHSVISPGTEKMKVEQARMSLLAKARARPDQVKKVLDTAKTLGWKAAIQKVRNRLESPSPLGYSAVGIVEAVDVQNTRYAVGDRVACGGAECAHHAEFIAVPDLLTAPVPDQVESWQAAYTTMLSISLQAVRQAEVGIGARVLILGQGLVGQLATAICQAGGSRVMAVDYDRSRLDKALQMGAERVACPATTSVTEAVREWSDGYGVDAVLYCIGGAPNKAVDEAIDCLRDRGILVIVGIQDATLNWKTCFAKDIQVRYSRSYGPGRYDPGYEWGGQDYPIGYVRWTENRNFEACLNLVGSRRIDLAPVTTRRATFSDAVTVYDELMKAGNADLGVVLEYGAADPGLSAAVSSAARIETSLASKSPKSTAKKLHVVGAGNFVRTMLLPHVQGAIALGTIVNQTGLSARHVMQKAGFTAAETDASKVFAHSGDAVIIGTRHHLHAEQVLAALQGQMQVFVEKPLCLTRDELAAVDKAVETSNGSVMVGFNRRFAPATVALKKALDAAPGPKMLTCHVHAGQLAADHWYANIAESGGRVVGEACHFFDLACHLLGAKPVEITAQAAWPGTGKLPALDTVAAQVSFDDGSCFHLIYTSAGDPAFPKESIRVSGSGLVAEIENFMKLTVYSGRKVKKQTYSSKGHAEEMAAWLAYLSGTAAHPLPYADSRQSMLLTFAALDAVRENRTLSLA